MTTISPSIVCTGYLATCDTIQGLVHYVTSYSLVFFIIMLFFHLTITSVTIKETT